MEPCKDDCPQITLTEDSSCDCCNEEIVICEAPQQEVCCCDDEDANGTQNNSNQNNMSSEISGDTFTSFIDPNNLCGRVTSHATMGCYRHRPKHNRPACLVGGNTDLVEIVEEFHGGPVSVPSWANIDKKSPPGGDDGEECCEDDDDHGDHDDDDTEDFDSVAVVAQDTSDISNDDTTEVCKVKNKPAGGKPSAKAKKTSSAKTPRETESVQKNQLNNDSSRIMRKRCHSKDCPFFTESITDEAHAVVAASEDDDDDDDDVLYMLADDLPEASQLQSNIKDCDSRVKSATIEDVRKAKAAKKEVSGNSTKRSASKNEIRSKSKVMLDGSRRYCSRSARAKEPVSKSRSRSKIVCKREELRSSSRIINGNNNNDRSRDAIYISSEDEANNDNTSNISCEETNYSLRDDISTGSLSDSENSNSNNNNNNKDDKKGQNENKENKRSGGILSRINIFRHLKEEPVDEDDEAKSVSSSNSNNDNKEAEDGVSKSRSKPKVRSPIKPKPRASSKVKQKPKTSSKVKPKSKVRSSVKPKPKATSIVKPKPVAHSKVKPNPKASLKPKSSAKASARARSIRKRKLVKISKAKKLLLDKYSKLKNTKGMKMKNLAHAKFLVTNKGQIEPVDLPSNYGMVVQERNKNQFKTRRKMAITRSRLSTKKSRSTMRSRSKAKAKQKSGSRTKTVRPKSRSKARSTGGTKKQMSAKRKYSVSKNKSTKPKYNLRRVKNSNNNSDSVPKKEAKPKQDTAGEGSSGDQNPSSGFVNMRVENTSKKLLAVKKSKSTQEAAVNETKRSGDDEESATNLEKSLKGRKKGKTQTSTDFNSDENNQNGSKVVSRCRTPRKKGILKPNIKKKADKKVRANKYKRK